ncbi:MULTISPECIES: TetR/AcrR family transcriptional regulator [Prauserella salsuginis group]|uniref:AcrR family transcriptional regulator n=2 Tax=Prauserella salsuginis group TaxID=2893672 RepID=A0A839XP06_9PSEU|nr:MULTISPECIES: TetR/AcrR family transcriptional regulator [Prauserella salsuginis group]MBB3662423.1 AcrR family transcriptional regulator [Prauserella sediminis]MCR3720133.1 transcriptional regulator, TetR family [Prauserella flava]MCR3734158.1 transcriptional regulator, TetR family [Prauserella salsuginis]
MSSKSSARGDSAVPPLADTSAFRAPPVTARGARTRAALVAAARVVFERDGFLDARLTDITSEAKCSTGSFYTYFSSKEEVFLAVVEEAQHDMLHPGAPHLDEDEASPAAVIEASNRAYLEAYKRNAKLMLILEQVAVVDPKFREVRRARSRTFAGRNARAIARLQEQGLVDPGIDPKMAAMALSGMVSRLAYNVFCLGDKASMKQLVDTTTRLWVNALKLDES